VASEPAPSVRVVSPAERWIVLLGALMVQVILGTVYGFSALVKPLGDQFKWSAKEIQIAFSLAILTFALVMVLAGRLQDKVGPRIPALIGAALLVIGSLLAAQVKDPSQRALWWLSYGLVYGAGIGFGYVCPIAALAKWFPDIKGLIAGVAVAGFGGGAAFFIPTVSNFLKNGHTVADFFVVHAIVCAIVVTIGASLLRNPPAGWSPPRKADADTGKPVVAKPAVADVAPGAMVATPRFWLLWAMFMGAATAGLMTISMAKVVAGAAAAATLAVFNAIGRVGWGGISDRIGRERAMMAMFAFQAVVMFALRAVNPQPETAAAIVLMGLIGLNFGGCFAVFPSATADAFGTKNMGINYGLVFTSYGIAGVVGPQIAAYYKDVVKSYLPAFPVAGVLVALAAVGAVVLHRMVNRPQSEDAVASA
jgi:OFA family oxalate/formate antiporter-like MFS transporter